MLVWLFNNLKIFTPPLRYLLAKVQTILDLFAPEKYYTSARQLHHLLCFLLHLVSIIPGGKGLFFNLQATL